MSDSYALDTGVLLHLLRGKALGAGIDRAFGLRSSMHRHVISIVTQAELSVIADRNRWGADKRATLQHALDNLVVVPVDGADLVQAFGRSRNMGKNDCWIAATALYAQLPLLTTDKDFRFLHPAPLTVMWIDPLQG